MKQSVAERYAIVDRNPCSRISFSQIDFLFQIDTSPATSKGKGVEKIYSFGIWLRRRRKALDLTQAALAQRVGCAEVTIRKIEADVLRPSDEMAERIALSLSLSGEERSLFLRVARAQLAVDHLPTSSQLPLAPPLPNHTIRRSNLPLQVTAFVERALEQAMLEGLISSYRLVTVSGVGGSGKTRLVLEVAQSLLNDFADGVWLVELASIQSSDLVVQAIVESLGIREVSQGDLFDALCAALHDQHMLLILDNCEHLVASCADVASELFRQCPRIRIVTTSREPLNLLGEHIYPIPPLAIPAADDAHSLDNLRQIESVRLFCDRAQAVQPRFTLTATNASMIAQICRCLDGLPLAIELAAVHLRRLPLQVLLERLQQPLTALVDGPRNLPLRQQALRTTIDWSYRLLDADQQQLFARLSVFTGSWSIQAVEAVCSAADEKDDLLIDRFASLLDKHLVQHVADFEDEPRFTMLETLRAYALEQLTLSGEAEALHWRHATYYLEFVERAVNVLAGPQASTSMKQLVREYENIRAVLHWAFSDTHADRLVLAIELCSLLRRFWGLRGYVDEGQRWLDLALVHGAYATTPQLASIWYGCGILTRMRGNFAQATDAFTKSLYLSKEHQDQLGVARALNSLGVLFFNQGKHDQARIYYEESLVLFQSLKDDHFTATTLNNLANIAYKQGDLEQAVQWYQQGLQLMQQGDTDPFTVALIKVNLADIARVRKQYGQALQLLHDGLNIYRELDDVEGILFCLTNIIEIAIDLRHAELVAQLLGAADVIYERSSIVRPPSVMETYKRHVAVASDLIGELTFEQVRARGRATAIEPLLTTAIDTLMPEAAK